MLFLVGFLCVAVGTASEQTLEADICAEDLELDLPDSNLNLLQRKATIVKTGVSPSDSSDEKHVPAIGSGVLSLPDAKETIESSAVEPADASNRSRRKDEIQQEQPQSQGNSSAIPPVVNEVAVAGFANLSQEANRNVTIELEIATPESSKRKDLIANAKLTGHILASLLVLFLVGIVVTLNICEKKFADIFHDSVTRTINEIAYSIYSKEDSVEGIINPAKLLEYDAVQVSVWRSIVTLTNIRIANPPPWNSERLLIAGAVHAKLNLWRYVRKRMFGSVEQVEVNCIEIVDVKVHVDKPSMSSNIADLQMILDGRKALESLQSTAKGDARMTNRVEDSNVKMPELIVHALRISNVRAAVPGWGLLVVPSFRYRDFDAEFKSEGRNARTSRDILHKVLARLCVEVLTSLSLANQSKR